METGIRATKTVYVIYVNRVYFMVCHNYGDNILKHINFLYTSLFKGHCRPVLVPIGFFLNY